MPRVWRPNAGSVWRSAYPQSCQRCLQALREYFRDDSFGRERNGKVPKLRRTFVESHAPPLPPKGSCAFL